MIKIGIVGSRRRNTLKDYEIVRDKLLELLMDTEPETQIILVSGGCEKGADSFVKPLVKEFEEEYNINYYEHLPKLPNDWNKLEGIQRKWAYATAAYDRNKLIAKDSDILIACVAEDRKGGTENTIKWFKKLYKGTRKLVLC